MTAAPTSTGDPSAVDVIRRLHQHRMWVNHNLLAAAAALSDESRRRQFAIGQGSVWKSLVHLYAAEYVWLASLLGDESPLAPGDVAGKLPGNQEGTGAIPSFERLQSDWATLDGRWQKYLAELSVADLDRPVVKVATAGKMAGQRFSTRCLDVQLHICTHSQYTSAQIVNMLRQLDVAPLPEVMLIALARSEAAAGR